MKNLHKIKDLSDNIKNGDVKKTHQYILDENINKARSILPKGILDKIDKK